METMILSMGAMMMVAFGLIWSVMWGARRWVHAYLSLAIGVAAIVYFAQNIIRGMLFCAQKPRFVPPTPEEAALGNDGRMVFNCDSAGGVLDRVYLYILGPAFIVALCVVTFRFARRELQKAPL